MNNKGKDLKQKIYVAIYARYSSINQNETSIEAQLKYCSEFAKNQGWVIVKKYIDKALTATDTNRDAFKMMMNDSKNGKFDIVLVHKYDRFARNDYDHLVNETTLNDYDVSLVSVVENLKNTPQDRLMKSVLRGLNQYYSENLSNEVMKTLLLKAQRAQHVGGLPPLGYDVVVDSKGDKIYIINELEAEAVRLIFSMYSNDYSYRHIIFELNKNGFKTKRGQAFGKNSLYEILRNEKYNGIYTYNKQEKGRRFQSTIKRNSRRYKDNDKIIRIENGMPRIISYEIWQMVQTRLKKRIKGRKSTNNKIYLLSSKIECGKCGRKYVANSRISGKKGKMYSSYRCGTKQRGKECTANEVSKNLIENLVLKTFMESVITNEFAVHITSMINQRISSTKYLFEHELKEIEEKLSENKSSANNIVNAIKCSTYSSYLQEALEKLEHELSELEYEYNKLIRNQTVQLIEEGAIVDKFNDFRNLLSQSETLKKEIVMKKYFNQFVNKVVFYNRNFFVIEYNLEGVLGEEIADTINSFEWGNVEKTIENNEGFTLKTVLTSPAFPTVHVSKLA